MKVLILLVVVHQALSCCLPNKHDISLFTETSYGSYNYAGIVRMIGDPSTGRQAMYFTSNGYTSITILDSANGTVYHAYGFNGTISGCYKSAVDNSTLQSINSNRCFPTEHLHISPLKLPLGNGMNATFFRGTHHAMNHTIQIEGAFIGHCRPLLVRSEVAGSETFMLFGRSEFENVPKVKIPEVCKTASSMKKRSSIPMAGFGHFYHI